MILAQEDRGFNFYYEKGPHIDLFRNESAAFTQLASFRSPTWPDFVHPLGIISPVAGVNL